MGYKELLSEMVEKSHMTLREIADKARDRGVSIDPSYISKLQTGKQPSASEEVSKVIAEVCGGDPDTLIWEGYLEKAPEIIQKYVIKSLAQVRESSKVAARVHYADDPLLESYMAQIEEMSALQWVKEIVNTEDNFVHYDEGSMVVDQDDGSKTKLLVNQSFEMQDDSMVPLISKGARATVKRQANYNNGDIVVVQNADELLVRKIIFNEDKVILIPENTRYETKILLKEEIKIGGKVNSVIVSL